MSRTLHYFIIMVSEQGTNLVLRSNIKSVLKDLMLHRAYCPEGGERALFDKCISLIQERNWYELGLLMAWAPDRQAANNIMANILWFGSERFYYNQSLDDVTLITLEEIQRAYP